MVSKAVLRKVMKLAKVNRAHGDTPRMALKKAWKEVKR
jgi:hypothetical protein